MDTISCYCGKAISNNDGIEFPKATGKSLCPECPPQICEICGGSFTYADLCFCWIRVKDIPLADAKALFADMDLSVDISEIEGEMK